MILELKTEIENFFNDFFIMADDVHYKYLNGMFSLGYALFHGRQPVDIIAKSQKNKILIKDFKDADRFLEERRLGLENRINDVPKFSFYIQRIDAALISLHPDNKKIFLDDIKKFVVDKWTLYPKCGRGFLDTIVEEYQYHTHAIDAYVRYVSICKNEYEIFVNEIKYLYLRHGIVNSNNPDQKRNEKIKPEIDPDKWQDLIKEGTEDEILRKWSVLKKTDGAKDQRAAAFIYLLAVNNYLWFTQDVESKWKIKNLKRFATAFYGKSLGSQFDQHKDDTKEDVDSITKKFNQK